MIYFYDFLSKMWNREKPILYKEEVVFWLLEISVRGWKIFVCEGSEK